MRRLRTLLIDIVLIGTATVLALALRHNLELDAEKLERFAPYLGLTLAAALLLLPATGMTRTLWRYAGLEEYLRLALCCLLIVVAAVAAGYSLGWIDHLMRSIPILQLLLMTALLAGLRLAGRLHRFRHERRVEVLERDPAGETVLVVGINAVTEMYLRSLDEQGAERVTVAGILGRHERQRGQILRSRRVLGAADEIQTVISELAVHGVMITRVVVAVAYDQLSERTRMALRELEDSGGLKVDMFAERLGFTELGEAPPAPAPTSADRAHPIRSAAEDANKLSAALRRPYWKVKRCTDALLALLAILALLPIMVLVGLLTMLSVGPPVVFWQQRPGRYGQPFKVYKFRTLLAALDARGRRLPDEARLTPTGRFLRATRLDELPQLFNILCGHMSFVGPRPLLDVDQLDAFRDRLWVRPGLTGWAQVNGGKSVSASDKMALDMWYIRNASFRLDCRIVLMTLRMVVAGERSNPIAVEQAWLELGHRP